MRHGVADLTRSDVALPEGMEALVEMRHLRVFELQAVPSNWKLDAAGRFEGYRKTHPRGT